MWLKVVDKGTTNKQQTQPNASLPRNESLSAIVKEKFDEVKKKSFKMVNYLFFFQFENK